MGREVHLEAQTSLARVKLEFERVKLDADQGKQELAATQRMARDQVAELTNRVIMLEGERALQESWTFLERCNALFRPYYKKLRRKAGRVLRPRPRPLPRITIVTPVYNGAAYIREAIESVFSQNYPNLEYIVVDGGSTDATLEIVKSFQGQNIRVISEPDNGMYDALAKGFALATGDILGWLNSDDLFEPNGLLRAGQWFQQHPDQHIVYHEDNVPL